MPTYRVTRTTPAEMAPVTVEASSPREALRAIVNTIAYEASPKGPRDHYGSWSDYPRADMDGQYVFLQPPGVVGYPDVELARARVEARAPDGEWIPIASQSDVTTEWRLRLIPARGGLVTAAQVAELLGISPRRVSELAISRNLGTLITPRMRLFSAADVDAMRVRPVGRPPKPRD